MKLRAERDVLYEALATVGRAASTRGSALPALSGIRMEVRENQLHLAGTDLDLTIQVEMGVGDGVDGVCVVPARLTAEIVRAVDPGAVSVVADGTEAVITAGRSEFSIRVLATEEFLRLPEPTGDVVNLAAGDFTEALRQVVPAASHDDARPILTGVLMAAEVGGLRLVATDSYRLALRDLPGTSVLGEGQQVLVPSRALGELSRVLAGGGEVQLRLGSTEATFQAGSTRLTTRLIDGEFPNYRELIPTSAPNRLVVGKGQFLDAVRRVRLLAREATPIRLTLGAGGVELAAVTQDVGEAREDVDAKYEGSEMMVAFNPAFLIDGVEAIPGDEVVLETTDALKPATIRGGEGGDFVYLLMPVRVS